jgi:hypothetical protein
MNTSTRIAKLEGLMEQVLQAIAMQNGIALADTPAPTAATKTWLNPTEAAQVLSLPITRSKTHTRRLKWYRDHGFLTRYQGERPVYYHHKDVAELAKRIERNEVVIPPVI